MDVSTPEALSKAIAKLTQDLATSNGEVSRLEENFRRASKSVKNAQDSLDITSNTVDSA
jgi:hypothetical protein